MINDRVVRIEARDRDNELLKGVQFEIYEDGSLIAETEDGEGFITIQVQPNVVLKVRASYGGYHREVNIAVNVDVMPISLRFAHFQSGS